MRSAICRKRSDSDIAMLVLVFDPGIDERSNRRRVRSFPRQVFGHADISRPLALQPLYDHGGNGVVVGNRLDVGAVNVLFPFHLRLLGIAFIGNLPPGSALVNSFPTDFGMPMLLLPAAAAYMAFRCFSLTGGMIEFSFHDL